MEFLRPFTARDRFAHIEDANGETIYTGPAEDRPDTPEGGTCTIDSAPLWYARLSAPGYLDCTEWAGGHATEAAALAALCDQYDLCPECYETHDECECAACREVVCDEFCAAARAEVRGWDRPHSDPGTCAACGHRF